jgi:hypothetical protein
VPAGRVVQSLAVERWDLDPSLDPYDGDGAHEHGGGEGVDGGGWDADVGEDAERSGVHVGGMDVGVEWCDGHADGNEGVKCSGFALSSSRSLSRSLSLSLSLLASSSGRLFAQPFIPGSSSTNALIVSALKCCPVVGSNNGG